TLRDGSNALCRSHLVEHFEHGIMYRLLEHECCIDFVVGGWCKNPCIEEADERNGKNRILIVQQTLSNCVAQEPKPQRYSYNREDCSPQKACLVQNRNQDDDREHDGQKIK